jgi:hypothetical protein
MSTDKLEGYLQDIAEMAERLRAAVSDRQIVVEPGKALIAELREMYLRLEEIFTDECRARFARDTDPEPSQEQRL